MNPNKTKRSLIDKANSNIVAITAVGAFLVVFSLVATRSLWAQKTFQDKVISKQKATVKQLDQNKENVAKLKANYSLFISKPENIIKGNPQGTGDRDGDNAKIVLDALPSKYDFPAFITSIKKLIGMKNLTLQSITGTDDEVAQNKLTESKMVEIPFTFSSEVGDYAQVKELLLATQQSIRPIKTNKLSLTGGQSGKYQVRVDAVSYYQGSKGITVKKETITQKDNKSGSKNSTSQKEKSRK